VATSCSSSSVNMGDQGPADGGQHPGERVVHTQRQGQRGSALVGIGGHRDQRVVRCAEFLGVAGDQVQRLGGVAVGEHSAVTWLVASSHCCRRRACWYWWALSIATPAAPVNASTTVSSSSVNSCPPVFSGQVQPAEDLTVRADRDPEERPHRRVLRGEPDGHRVLRQITEPLSLTLGGRYTKDTRDATRTYTSNALAFVAPPGVPGCAFVTGSPQYPLSDIPFQTIVERAAAGVYQAKPARVFAFDQLQEAHRLMESSRANGKIVVRL